MPDSSTGLSPETTMRFRILHAVDRSLSELSVTDLCKSAGISRYTFYRYFDSKYDIAIWHGRYCQSFYLDEVGRTIDWKTGYFHDLRLLSQEKEFYTHSLDYTLYSSEGLRLMDDHRKSVIIETLREYRHEKIDDLLMFCIDAFVRLETDLIARWLRDGFRPEPSVFSDYMINVIPRRLYHAMEI